MRKTANYDLCQWDPEDRILREDFNRDNQKIDETMAGLNPIVKLLDVTTKTDAKEVDLDLTGVDWPLYREIQVWYQLNTTHTTTDTLMIRLNRTTNYNNPEGNYSDSLSSFLLLPYGSSVGKITLYGGQNTAGFTQGTSSYSNLPVDTAASASLAPTSCSTMNFIMSTGKLQTGAEFKIYGVRK